MVAMSAATKKNSKKTKKQRKKSSHYELLFSVVSSAFTGTLTLLFTGSATLAC
jgi:long-subunit acyl-CoA synthetase (AMP-forming)